MKASRLVSPFVLVLFAVGLAALQQTARAGQDPPAIDVARPSAVANSLPAIAELVRSVQPSVVSITVRRFVNSGDRLGRAKTVEREAGGTGIIVRADGRIVTNQHVINDADEITVTLTDDRTFEATLLGADAATDLALLRIDADGLTPAVFADSDQVQVGEWVVAIGDPLGLDHTVTLGIVSAVHRTGIGANPLEDFIQTDAALNPGNSGGPLFNLSGQVVGISDAILSPTHSSAGLGLAIAANLARPVIRDLLDGGVIRRNYLGVSVADAASENEPESSDSGDSLLRGSAGAQRAPVRHSARASGTVRVAAVTPESPAERAGLQRDDVIRRFNGRAIRTPADLGSAVAATLPQQQVTVEVLRNGKPQQLRVELEATEPAAVERFARRSAEADVDEPDAAKRDNPHGPDRDRPNAAERNERRPPHAPQAPQMPDRRRAQPETLGATIHTVTPRIARMLGYPEELTGVVIGEIGKGSRAEGLGLRVGDIIVGVNGERVEHEAGFEAALQEAARAEKMMLVVLRDGRLLTAVAPATR